MAGMQNSLFERGQAEVGEPTPNASTAGKPRLRLAVRDQVIMHCQAVDELLPPEHVARSIWAYVSSLDLSGLLEQVEAVEGVAGRNMTDPRILLTLWLYATIEGIGSARQLDRLCQMHAAYRWICGGVSLNHHTLSDFRVGHGKFLDQLLTRSVAALMHTGVVQLERVAHDGMRVRAGAGKKSFRGRLSMERCLRQAQQRVQRLQAELQADPAVDRDRLRAARERAAQESAARVAQALAELAKLEARKQAAQTGRKKEPRVSLTDPEARTMKMADSGFRPAYNVQFATDTATRVVVGVDVTNIGSDQGQMRPMFEQLHQRYARGPREYLADGDFTNLHDIDHLERAGVRVYAPPRRPRNPDRPVHAPVDRDTPATRIWRKRMAGEEAQRIYRQRASTAEFVNAQARNHGLRQFVVRGLAKVRTIALWHALAHNLQRMFSLTKTCQLAT